MRGILHEVRDFTRSAGFYSYASRSCTFAWQIDASRQPEEAAARQREKRAGGEFRFSHPYLAGLDAYEGALGLGDEVGAGRERKGAEPRREGERGGKREGGKEGEKEGRDEGGVRELAP
jgi:hypothetical protein